MNKKELQSILAPHRSWLHSMAKEGSRADLCGAFLRGAFLRGAVLRGAFLCDADLRDADLRVADLRGADLRGAVLRGAVLPLNQVCPEEGDFIAFKKLRNGTVCKVKVPAEAKRITGIGQRKCRVEYVDVLEGEGESKYDGTPYRIGKRVYPDKFDPDERVACSNGIHVFITRKEAEDW